MSEYVVVWDLETIPDLACVARVNLLADGDDAGARAALGDKFPKLLFHKVACIEALLAERIDGVWNVRSLGAPHMGERSEAESLQTFVDLDFHEGPLAVWPSLWENWKDRVTG